MAHHLAHSRRRLLNGGEPSERGIHITVTERKRRGHHDALPDNADARGRRKLGKFRAEECLRQSWRLSHSTVSTDRQKDKIFT
ncbi:hypothetical protein GCM10023322_70970 [Rugosimonospora acidiphila]|uniref:Uncharacterized protein n=1 Tax=Rugosimonospora acidiphila TaxID=556531 RepID=A0ABP9SN74_9ACTN